MAKKQLFSCDINLTQEVLRLLNDCRVSDDFFAENGTDIWFTMNDENGKICRFVQVDEGGSFVVELEDED